MQRGCISARMLPPVAGVTSTGMDTVAGPSGPETSGPVDSWGVCWKAGELELGQVCDGGGLGRKGAGRQSNPPQESIETFHLRPHNGLPQLPQPLSLQLLSFYF